MTLPELEVIVARRCAGIILYGFVTSILLTSSTYGDHDIESTFSLWEDSDVDGLQELTEPPATTLLDPRHDSRPPDLFIQRTQEELWVPLNPFLHSSSSDEEKKTSHAFNFEQGIVDLPAVVHPESLLDDKDVEPAQFVEPSDPLDSNLFPQSITVFGSDFEEAFPWLAIINATLDLGDAIPKADSTIRKESRNPDINDPIPASFGNRQVLSSGSHWVPARMDLDTAVSKIDSRSVKNVNVIKGPFTSLHGPTFSAIDFELFKADLFDDGVQFHGQTSVDHKANGEQWHGRQAVWGGGKRIGFRLGYGHRTGSDYRAGNGEFIPASYNTQTFDFAIGAKPNNAQRIDIHYLRLDQENVELPGQAFDISALETDGLELEYVVDGFLNGQLHFETWFNQTRLYGDMDGKQDRFEILRDRLVSGMTDVESISTGHQVFVTWRDDSFSELIVGTDLRYIKQELNELTNIKRLGEQDRFFNSPIPRSHSSNPGVFAEGTLKAEDGIWLRFGGRLDWTSANIDGDDSTLLEVGRNPDFDFRTDPPDEKQLTLAEHIGTSDFDRDFNMWSLFSSLGVQTGSNSALQFGCALAQRPPNLTELYAVQPFMFVLQSGINTVTGNGLLSPERLFQIDVGWKFDNEIARIEIAGYHGWVHDYITYEELSTAETTQFSSEVRQVNLQFVNTELAALWGGQASTEVDISKCLLTFCNVSYSAGADRTRNGRGNDINQIMINDVGINGRLRDKEPLPNMAPLNTVIGLRLHDTVIAPNWVFEFSNRIVARQDRVAISLLEHRTPGFELWDFRAFWKAKNQSYIFFGIENLGDSFYQEYFDFRPITNSDGITQSVYRPGRNFYLGAHIEY